MLNPAMDTPEVRAEHRRDPDGRAGRGDPASSATTRWSCSATGTRACPAHPSNADPRSLRPGPARRGGRPAGRGRPAGAAPGHGHLPRRAVRSTRTPTTCGSTRSAWRPSRRRAIPHRFPDAGQPYQPLKLYYTVWPAEPVLRALHEKFLELGLESPFDEEWLARLERPTTRRAPRTSTSPASTTCGARPCWPTPPRSTPPRRSGSACRPRCRPASIPSTTTCLARSRVGPVEVDEDDLFDGHDLERPVAEPAARSTTWT